VSDAVVLVRARVVDLRTIDDGETVSYGATYRAEGRRRIATLGIGYADGYRRILGNHAVALVGGRRAPVVGVVTMDMTMLDVTDVPCNVGDVATLMGADGSDRITVADVARFGDLSPYEVLTGLRGRLPRRYVGPDGAA
jgi:alanine racemase